MKAVIITDTHWGARGDKQALINHYQKFYRDVFFPYIRKNNIKTVWHLGDLVDRRKFINFNTLDNMKNEFLDPLERMKVDCHFIMGNHDMYYKNKVLPNALDELLGEYNFAYYCEPTELPDQNVLVLPWICEETKEKSYDLISNSKMRFVFGHLEIKDFETDRGRFAKEGDDRLIFGNFENVLSGHYHHKSSYDNINYLGAPYEMTWNDYNDTKGFHVFDFSTNELSFIENPYKLFHKIIYDDKKNDLTTMLKTFENMNFKDTFVKIVVKAKENSFWFDTVLDKLNEQYVSDIQIVDDNFNLNMDTDEGILEQAEDTLTILSKFVESSDLSADKDKVISLLKELYHEATLVRV